MKIGKNKTSHILLFGMFVWVLLWGTGNLISYAFFGKIATLIESTVTTMLFLSMLSVCLFYRKNLYNINNVQNDTNTKNSGRTSDNPVKRFWKSGTSENYTVQYGSDSHKGFSSVGFSHTYHFT